MPVTTRHVELSELQVREVKVQEMKSVEASLRLDAIASAGFRTSRSKIVDMVKAGDIRYPMCHAAPLHCIAYRPYAMICCGTCVML